MRLTPLEREVLYAIQFNADRSVNEIAQICGKRTHQVRHALSRLQQRDVIRPYAVIDAQRLGYFRYRIYFSPDGDFFARRDQFIRFALTHRAVSGIYENCGEFEYSLALFIERELDLQNIYWELCDKFPGIFARKFTTPVFRFRIFGRKYLLFDACQARTKSGVAAERKSENSSTKNVYIDLSEGEGRLPVVIDNKDHLILYHLSHHQPYPSLNKLARITGIPISTVAYHVDRLKQTRVLQRVACSINCTAYDMRVFRCLVYTRGVSKQQDLEFDQAFYEHPNIVSYETCLGLWDYTFRVEAYSREHVRKICDDLYGRFEGLIEHIRIVPGFEELGYNLYPFPLDLPPHTRVSSN